MDFLQLTSENLSDKNDYHIYKTKINSWHTFENKHKNSITLQNSIHFPTHLFFYHSLFIGWTQYKYSSVALSLTQAANILKQTDSTMFALPLCICETRHKA